MSALAKTTRNAVEARAAELEAEADGLFEQARAVRIYDDSPWGITPNRERVQHRAVLREQARAKNYAARELRSIGGKVVTGPYIVTVKGPERPDVSGYDFGVQSRRAVATLDEAKDVAWAIANGHERAFDWRGRDAACAIPDSGSTIGPLPDGTVVEVEPVDAAELWRAIPGEIRRWRLSGGDSLTIETERIVAAYNEAQS